MPSLSLTVRLARLLAGLLAVVIAAGLAAPQACAQAPGLTLAEREWLAVHPRVTAVVLREAEPWYSSAANAPLPQGFGIDLMDIVAHRAGFELDYVSVATTAQALEAVRSGRADVIPISSPSPSRLAFLSFPGPFVPAEQVIVSRTDVGDVSSGQDFAGRRIAVVDDTTLAESLAVEFPRANLVHFPNRLDAFRAIADGRADLGIGWLPESVYTVEANFLANLRIRRSASASRSFIGPAVSRRQPLLDSIIAKAIASLSPMERSAAARRWLPSGVDALWLPGKATLSPAESAWVQRAGGIKLGYDEHFAPFTSRGALDSFEGLGADMLRLAASKVGLHVIEQRGGSFADVYEASRHGDLNVVVGMARTEMRRADFDFIGPFSRSPTAMILRNTDRRLWSNPDDIQGGTLGMLREHFIMAQLRSRRPALPLVTFDSQEDVLAALDRGEVDAAIGNGVVVNRLIEQRYSGRLHIAGVVPDNDSELYFAVPHAQPELARLLQHGLDAITPAEQAEIQRRWLFVSLQPGVRWRDVLEWGLPIGLAAALVLATLVSANRRLRAVNDAAQAARATAEEATAARGRFLAYLAHELRGSIGAIGSGADLLLDMDDPALRKRVLGAVKTSADGLQNLLETTLAHERSMATGLVLVPVATALTPWWDAMMAPWTLAARAKGLDLQARAPVASRPLRFDATRLAQALGNVIGNAIKFTPAGRVEVEALWHPALERLTVRVTDSGPGLSPADRQQLFLPYAQGQQGRSVQRGAGLGLAISRDIVVAMGGTIELRDNGTLGAQFVIEVPLQ